jgi:phosphopantothenoylcysteine decarboxylase / phosphopantothenate---cysteine ligase
MLKHKILYQISGSIAAYKSAYLISKLVQNGFDVQTVATQSALQFIGKATLEGLTSKPVLTDQFRDGEMMGHISLIKWADLIILAPASANTINKLANGIGDNLVSSLFLAYNFDKPYLIVPAMNTNMFNHPSTRESIEKLKSWGIRILPTESGYLACGDYGEGKFLDPEKIYNYITESLEETYQTNKNAKKVVITSGATREKIDQVRFISNISTGKTAASIADYLSAKGNNVVFIHGKGSALPNNRCENIQYETFDDLKSTLYKSLIENDFDYIIHLAAVSDYTLDKIADGKNSFVRDKSSKIESGLENLILYLKPTEKLADQIKQTSRNKNVKLISFKLSGHENFEKSLPQVEKIFVGSDSDFVILNHLKDRSNDIQSNFTIIERSGNQTKAGDSRELSKLIEHIISGK